MRKIRGWPLGAAFVLLAAACGGADSGPPAVSLPGESPGPAAVSPWTITITSAGFDRHSLTAAVGDEVTFLNQDTAPHQVASDPHPVHTDCPEFNGPVLQPGQSFTATVTSAGRRCGVHDHLNPNNPDLRATITVGSAAASEDGSGAGGYERGLIDDEALRDHVER